ncbi:uncharacterized protein [Rutidosis leptorrhynchoides]|uniref:uncharacterized protein isoform X2 n=1 Tax=Rutidosis leptorrhynchoides TaxID=125765 RepID=UPI003A98E75D
MDQPARSKRPLDRDIDDVDTNPANKKLRLAVNLKKVAEIVIVLASIGKIRAGRKPTSVEVNMMVEAREKLAEICEEFSPKDVFNKEAFGKVFEELGLNRLSEMKLGIRPPKMSISQKLELTKLKMEQSDVVPPHSATPRWTSEVKPGDPGVLTSSHLVRCSTASAVNQTGRPQFGSIERSNDSVVDQKVSLDKAGSDKGPSLLKNINQRAQSSPSVETHIEIGKLVQKVLYPHIPEHKKWNPPSRDYMNKALSCQTCKVIINEVDTALVCDACERGYHLRCSQCNLKSIFGEEWREWHCAKCLTISNGKPIPPKYGRVLRNVSTPKVSSSIAGAQTSVEKKPQSADEILISA